jgi:hypothetical protein
VFDRVDTISGLNVASSDMVVTPTWKNADPAMVGDEPPWPPRLAPGERGGWRIPVPAGTQAGHPRSVRASDRALL